MTFAFCEKEESVGVAGLETADAFTDGVTGLDAGGEISNNSTISDVFLDLVFDERDDELALLLDPWTFRLRTPPNGGSGK